MFALDRQGSTAPHSPVLIVTVPPEALRMTSLPSATTFGVQLSGLGQIGTKLDGPVFGAAGRRLTSLAMAARVRLSEATSVACAVDLWTTTRQRNMEERGAKSPGDQRNAHSRTFMWHVQGGANGGAG